MLNSESKWRRFTHSEVQQPGASDEGGEKSQCAVIARDAGQRISKCPESIPARPARVQPLHIG
eukprot:6213894-Pleurochrysis_carterae.AAC.2